MKQGSIEWLAWRRGIVGASDQTMLQMCAPWSIGWGATWDIKKGRAPESPENEYMRKGNELEGHARFEYEMKTGRTMDPALLVSADCEYIGCSLDGYLDSKKKRRFIEIKVPGEDDHEKAKRGEIPAKYLAQISQQFYVTKAVVADYCSYRDGELVIVEVLPNKEAIEAVVETAHRFWDYVKRDVRPEEDFPHPLFDARTPVVTDAELLTEAEQNVQWREQVKALEGKIKASDKRILELCTLPKAKIGGLQIISTTRQGTIDAEAAKAAGVDLEQFRGEAKTTRSLRRI